MFPKPECGLRPNSFAYETRPLVKPAGFREYDVRWLLGEEINLMGVQAPGMGLGTLLGELNEGATIFADKVGVMLARHLSGLYASARFVVDVKSTCLFQTDPVLRENGAATEHWKTGHSYIKRRVKESGALAGFEKSGHFVFGPPLGRGYDDGCLAAIAICEMMDRGGGRSLVDLARELPQTWGSPTMSPHCADAVKYEVVERVVKRLAQMKAGGDRLAGQPIAELLTINGARAVVEDGTWGLVRASSNKPELVVVVESPVSEARMREMVQALDGMLRDHPGIGAYNQTI